MLYDIIMTEVILIASDNETKFTISRKAAKLSDHLSSMLEECDENSVEEIPMMEIAPDILEKIVQFLNYHVDNPPEDIKPPIKTSEFKSIACPFDSNLLDLKWDTVIAIINAANYLHIECLLKLAISKLATIVYNKDAEELRVMFNLPKLSEEEEDAMEERIRTENPWIVDPELYDYPGKA